MVCFRCGKENPEGAAFCQACGATLDLNAYLADLVETKVAAALAARLTDSKVAQSEWVGAAIEKLWGWLKLFAGFVGVPVGLFLLFLAAAGYRTYSDLTTQISQKKVEVSDGVKKADADLANLSERVKKSDADLASLSERNSKLGGMSTSLDSEFKALKEKIPAEQQILADLEKVRRQGQELGTQLAQVSQQQDRLTAKVAKLTTDTNLDDLQPQVAALARRLLEAADHRGLRYKISETCRTPEAQRAADLRLSQATNHPTTFQRKPGVHSYGLAFDVVKIDDGGNPTYKGSFEDIGNLGEKLGLTWGGSESPMFRDPNHFQGVKYGEETAAAISASKLCTVSEPPQS